MLALIVIAIIVAMTSQVVLRYERVTRTLADGTRTTRSGFRSTRRRRRPARRGRR